MRWADEQFKSSGARGLPIMDAAKVCEIYVTQVCQTHRSPSGDISLEVVTVNRFRMFRRQHDLLLRILTKLRSGILKCIASKCPVRICTVSYALFNQQCSKIDSHEVSSSRKDRDGLTTTDRHLITLRKFQCQCHCHQLNFPDL